MLILSVKLASIRAILGPWGILTKTQKIYPIIDQVGKGLVKISAILCPRVKIRIELEAEVVIEVEVRVAKNGEVRVEVVVEKKLIGATGIEMKIKDKEV